MYVRATIYSLNCHKGAMLSTICSAKQKSLQMCAELRHCQRWVTDRERQRVPQCRTRDGKTSPLQNVKGNSLSGGIKCTGEWGKFANFDRNLYWFRKRYEIRGIYAHNYYGPLIGSHRSPTDLCQFHWPWVTLKGGMWGSNFLADLRLIVWSGITKFCG